MTEKIVIFKNEKIGDLIHGLDAINIIISSNPDKKIVLYLSENNKEMIFLFKNNNVETKVISEKINFIDKLNIFKQVLINNIIKIYILKPSSFLFLLPLIFFYKKTKYFGICVKKKNYFRPSNLLRKLLKFSVINDRKTTKIRKSIYNLHINLVKEDNKIYEHFQDKKNLNNENQNKNKYILIHYNRFKYNELGWSLEDLTKLIKLIIGLSIKVYLTNDLNDEKTNKHIKDISLSGELFKHYPNVTGKEFFNLIGQANIVISMHGSITSIAAYQNVCVIDLFNCSINNKNDIYRYKNSFHEFKPKKDNYEFLIPKRNFNITMSRIENLLANGRKINY